MGAIVWNLITWWLGLPSSSSHALVGGLCGACLAAANNNWAVIIWSVPGKEHWWEGKGILWKVVVPMITSPICGLVGGFLVMGTLYFLLRNWRPMAVNKVFGKLQLMSAAYMGFSHGTNDAQKTMGIIFLALVAGTSSGTFDSIGGGWSFLSAPEQLGSVPAARVELGRMKAEAGDRAGALAEYRKAADAGDKTGKFLYATAVKESGRDAKEAAKAEATLAALAAEKFDAGSIKPAAPVFRKFKDQPADPGEGRAWLEKKAAAGNADALVALGAVRFQDSDFAGAKELFERAAKRNHPAAHYNLGLMSRNGRGVPKDAEHAAKMFHTRIRPAASWPISWSGWRVPRDGCHSNPAPCFSFSRA